MAAQAGHARGKFGVVGQRGAAFAGGDDLDRMETEDGDVAVAAVADRGAEIFAADGVRGVLDDAKTITFARAP